MTDVLDILGVGYREDSFTDFMNYLYGSSKEFRFKFLSKFLKSSDGLIDMDSILLTRSQYVLKRTKKIVPDMVCYSKKLNELSLIEVKLLAGQGYKQLKRYKDGINSLIETLDLDSDCRINLYYLSIENDLNQEDAEDGWNYVSWLELEDLFHLEDVKFKEGNIICEAVIKRINSLKKRDEYLDLEKYSFNDFLRWDYWKSPDYRIEEMLKSNDNFNKLLEGYDYWVTNSFSKAENKNETSIAIRKKDWLSDLRYFDLESKISSCYDFHIEIKMSPNLDDSNMAIRLDHHLNPYQPNSVMKESGRYDYYYEGRKSFIEKIKFELYPELASKGYRYNRASGNYLWILRKDISIKNDIDAGEVLEDLLKEIDYLMDLVEIFRGSLLEFDY